jgi:hypothetical protein
MNEAAKKCYPLLPRQKAPASCASSHIFLKFVGLLLTSAAVEVEINTVGTNEMGVSAAS